LSALCVCVCVCVYRERERDRRVIYIIYVYIYIHTHTHRESSIARQIRVRTLRRNRRFELKGDMKMVGALTEVGRKMGRAWTVRLLIFVGDTSGSVHKEFMEKNLAELQVLKSKWKGIREGLVRRLLEEQDKTFRCYYASKLRGQQGQGAGGKETGQMHLGGEVYVSGRDTGKE
jgi:hypothetical protein